VLDLNQRPKDYELAGNGVYLGKCTGSNRSLEELKVLW
jgi:hypothetical protein